MSLKKYSKKDHGIIKKDIDPDINIVAETLIASGYQAYLVGGCLRDMLLGKKPKDFDVVTIRPDPYFEEQKTVSIDGFVYYPGEYILSSPTDKVTDIILNIFGLLGLLISTISFCFFPIKPLAKGLFIDNFLFIISDSYSPTI